MFHYYLLKKGINYTVLNPSLHTQQRWFLPGGAVQCGGRAAGEVLLDALVVSDLCGHRDGSGLSSGGHHRGLSRGGLRLPAGEDWKYAGA